MPDYKKGKIYTIRCKTDDSLIYVGSTVESLSSRLSKHKFDSKLKPQRILYSHVQDWNDWYIELYEDFACERKEQLLQREGQVIREIGTLNKKIQGRTKQEYKKEYDNNNKDKIKEYRNNFKEKRREYDKDYYNNNKDKIKEYHKEYYKEYYNENKDKIKQKITCECGCIIRKGDISSHKKTNKHINIMKTIQTQEVC